MEGLSHPEGTVPKKVQFVLDWNPQVLTARGKNTARNPIGYTRPAAFYDKHLASHLVLERVVYLDTLVSAMGSTVDQAIQDAINKGFLPKDAGPLDTVKAMERNDYTENWATSLDSKLRVAEIYLKHAARYCPPIASTLVIHPSFRKWHSVLMWCRDQNVARWAVADGVLQISDKANLLQQLLENEGNTTRAIIGELASQDAALAVWEMKSLDAGPVQVMEQIAEMGVARAQFKWKRCFES